MLNYSVLMTVYAKETASNLDMAITSMMKQTIPTNDFVLVCDGDLNDDLDGVIHNYTMTYPGIFNVIRIPKNPIWAEVLNLGLKNCKNELVSRMDSDDISVLDRCEKLLKCFSDNPDVDVVGSALAEFTDNPKDIDCTRLLPESHEKIVKFAVNRCPMNHATVMYKKSKIISCGGYEYYPAFEDYQLWIKLIMANCTLYNLQESLYLMRAGDNLYSRRGGRKYSKQMIRFRKWMYNQGFISYFKYIYICVGSSIVYNVPNKLKAFIYRNLLRN